MLAANMVHSKDYISNRPLLMFVVYIQDDEGSVRSDELAVSLGGLKVADESYILSPRGTGSTLSSSGNENGVAVAAAASRSILLEHHNKFLIQCQIQPI